MAMLTIDEVAFILSRKYHSNKGFFELWKQSYPYEFSLCPPNSTQLAADFPLVRQWQEQWNKLFEQDEWKNHFVKKDINHRDMGEQKLLLKLVFNSQAEVEKFVWTYASSKDKDPKVQDYFAPFGGDPADDPVILGTFDAFTALYKLLEKPLYPSLDPNSPAFKTRLTGLQLYMLDNARKVALLGSNFLIAMQFVDFLAALPATPHLYLRQFSLPHMHTKFIEQNYKLLDHLLTYCLPPERQLAFANPLPKSLQLALGLEVKKGIRNWDEDFVVSESGTGTSTPDSEVESANGSGGDGPSFTNKPLQRFIQRWGFKLKAELSRLRSLDPVHISLLDAQQGLSSPEARGSEVSLELDTLNAWQASNVVKHVIICENEISYLSLPQISNTIAVWGSGYRAAVLGRWQLLQQVDVIYWGDIDTHGFAILNQLRKTVAQHAAVAHGQSATDAAAFFPHNIRSIMMDESTIEQNQAYGVTESAPCADSLDYLTENEQQAYQSLLSNSHGINMRIEQEFIPFVQMLTALAQALPTEQITIPQHFC